jgi:hypothetical protein
MRDRYTDGWIRVDSNYSQGITSLGLGDFDLGVFVSSWDARCLEVTQIDGLRVTTSILMLFDEVDLHGRRSVADRRLSTFLEERSERVTEVRGSVANLEGTFAELWRSCLSAAVNLERPLNVLLDITTAPRYYSLGVVSFLLRSGIASTVTAIYSEGSYPEQGAEFVEIEFTRGEWHAVTVPGLEGIYEPERRKFYLVSAGFEGSKTLRVVSRADPDRVCVLAPDPGTKEGYAERMYEDNRLLLSDYARATDNSLIRASAGDVVEALRNLQEAAVERPQQENTYYLCTGTKAHSLALGIRALLLEFPAVIYHLPDAHRSPLIAPTGRYWRYDVTNLTARGAGRKSRAAM